MNNKTKISATLATGVIAAATTFIITWEGNKLKPYLDVGNIPTVCAGVTKGIEFSRIYTSEECVTLNTEAIVKHAAGVGRCVQRTISDKEWVALISFAYNVGVEAACNSTLMRMLNNEVMYCAQYLRWDKVQGVTVRGLTRRRTAEQQLCMEGHNER